MSKHTPGPLFVSGKAFNRTVVRYYDNKDGLGKHEVTVAAMGVPGNHDAEMLANANLFAAAPELIESLKDCLNCIYEMSKGHENPIDTGVITSAEAIIKKAEGA